MTLLTSAKEPVAEANSARSEVLGETLDTLADIYREETNIAIWSRELPSKLSGAAQQILKSIPKLQISVSERPEKLFAVLCNSLGSDPAATTLATDIAEFADTFAYLFDIERVGVRLTALGNAMCPRFHVDRVPCRLVSTYVGNATEWLPHQRVNRNKLGPGNQGLADDRSGLYSNSDDIQQLLTGEVALLKGESWEGNEGAGLVHRSPQLPAGARRLLLTIDFSI